MPDPAPSPAAPATLPAAVDAVPAAVAAAVAAAAGGARPDVVPMSLAPDPAVGSARPNEADYAVGVTLRVLVTPAADAAWAATGVAACALTAAALARHLFGSRPPPARVARVEVTLTNVASPGERLQRDAAGPAGVALRAVACERAGPGPRAGWIVSVSLLARAAVLPAGAVGTPSTSTLTPPPTDRVRLIIR